MGYPTFIGGRYIRSGKKRSISAITGIAVFGVALGVSSLSVVLSISSGFEDEFTRKVLGVNAHVLVMKYGIDFTEYREVMSTVESIPEVKGVAPFVIQEMMITRGEHTAGVLLKGVDPDKIGTVLDLPSHIEEGGIEGLRLPGSRPPPPPSGGFGASANRSENGAVPAAPEGGSSADGGVAEAGAKSGGEQGEKRLPGIVLGRTLAENLEAELGDVVRVTTPLVGLDVLGWSPSKDTPRTLAFEVTGIFYAGFLEYDTKLVYVDLHQAQRFFEHGDSVTGVEVTVHDIHRAGHVGRRIKQLLDRGPYHTVDWEMLNAPLFTALKTQKVVLTVVYAVIIGVAAFSIIATLVMMVFEKRREIAILKSMGASRGGILLIFMYYGLVVGLAGIAIGLLVGFGACFLLHEVGWPLDPKVYLIDHLPVALDARYFVATALIAFVICMGATIVPCLSASRLRPVDGLRGN